MLLTYIIAAEMYVYYHLSVPTYPHLPKNLGQEGLLTEQGSHPSLFFLLQGKRLACPEVMTVFVWLTGGGGGGHKYKKNNRFNSLSTSFRCCSDNHWEGSKYVFCPVSPHYVVHLELLHSLRNTIDSCIIEFKCLPL